MGFHGLVCGATDAIKRPAKDMYSIKFKSKRPNSNRPKMKTTSWQSHGTITRWARFATAGLQMTRQSNSNTNNGQKKEEEEPVIEPALPLTRQTKTDKTPLPNRVFFTPIRTSQTRLLTGRTVYFELPAENPLTQNVTHDKATTTRKTDVTRRSSFRAQEDDSDIPLAPRILSVKSKSARGPLTHPLALLQENGPRRAA